MCTNIKEFDVKCVFVQIHECNIIKVMFFCEFSLGFHKKY